MADAAARAALSPPPPFSATHRGPRPPRAASGRRAAPSTGRSRNQGRESVRPTPDAALPARERPRRTAGLRAYGRFRRPSPSLQPGGFAPPDPLSPFARGGPTPRSAPAAALTRG